MPALTQQKTMPQIFVRDLQRTRCLQLRSGAVSGRELRATVAAATGLPLPELRLVSGTREVHDDAVLHAAGGLFPSCTVLLRLCGGKARACAHAHPLAAAGQRCVYAARLEASRGAPALVRPRDTRRPRSL